MQTVDEDSVTSASSSFRGSITGLSALTNVEDIEPLLNPDDSDFTSQFLIDDDDPIWDIIEDEETTQDDLLQIGGQDFIDIMEAFVTDIPDDTDLSNEDVVYNKFPYCKVPKGVKKIKYLPTYEALDGTCRLIGRKGEDRVYISNSIEEHEVGVKDDDTTLNVELIKRDYFKIANMYSEEVGGKGVGLGFSSFVHSTAIMIIAKNTLGVIESHEGHDYAFDGKTIEVTGLNYKERQTSANITISKYLIIGFLLKGYDYQEIYIDWSWKEDTGMINSFAGTAFDYETTDRSEIVKRLAGLLPKMTISQRAALGRNYLAYRSEQPVISRDKTTKNRDFTLTEKKIADAIVAGSKRRDSIDYVPSPFRVLYPQDEPDILTFEEVSRRQSTRVRTTQWGKSTYHTWNVNHDPTDVCMSEIANYAERKNYTKNSIHDILYQSYKKYKSFTSASIQAALLPKIYGKGGCFYDIYNRVGITWHRKNSKSLSWFCLYYTFNHPGIAIEVGEWHHDSLRGIYLSPTFKVSRQDIHYAQVLPAKIVSSLASCRPLMTPQDYRDVEKKIIMTMCIQSNSTWATSHRTGANRFLTCCHMSESGDLPSLMEGQLSYMKFHRFSDYFVLKLMLNYIRDRPSRLKTPLFRLPLSAMSYEKDFSQTLQWHMRDTDHSTNCMIKVTAAAKRHALEENSTNEWLELQYDYIKKSMIEGTTPEEYKHIMLSAPDHPTLNLVMFVGMCSLVKDDIKDIGSVQHSMGFTVWSMLTDRHCIDYNGTTTEGVPKLTTSKVVEAMSKYLHSIGGVSGAYELIAKMSKGQPLPPNYLLNHYKDAKESEREISQMFPQHRIKQCFPETLTETFTGNNDADQMSDSMKYNKHVTDTMDPELRGRAFHASEDRSKFCQEMEAQLQALGLAAISYEAGSTALRSAAAMTFMNKTRVIVYPHEADHDKLLDGWPCGDAIVTSQKKRHITKTVRIEKNMTQGLGAVTAGAINTIYVTAQDKIICKLIDGLESKTARTTSDDVKRSAVYKGECNKQSAAANFFFSPNEDLKMCMMVSNDKKFMPSEYMSEFNNVVSTISGMVPQSPIFSTLCIQALLSKSLFGDIVTVVNTSRSTMSWGCPPDTMQASLDSLIRVLRQKWLLSDEDVDTLWLSGFFPDSTAEHIAGFWIRDEDMLKRVFGAFTDEQKQDVLSGDVALYDMLKRAELDLGKRKKKKKQKHKPIKGLIRANRVADGIYRQRYTAEKLLSRHVQPIGPAVRSAAKKRFFQLINGDIPDIDISELIKLAPPKVTVVTRAARRIDRLPTSIGTSSELSTVSLQRIRAKRHLDVQYRDFLTDKELEISNMKEEDYEKAVAVLEKTKHYEGLSFKSPVGLPLTRIYDNTIFTRPASFNFAVDIDAVERSDQPFTFRGVQVTDFKPIVLGSDSINSIHNTKKDRLAFGYGFLRSKLVVFFKGDKRGDEIQAIRVPNWSRNITSVKFQSLTIHYRMALDASPLLSMHHKSEAKPYLPGLLGDNEAILNYGFYCRSNQPSGFSIYRKLYSNYKSVMPYFVVKHMPQYPFFPFPEATSTHIRGRLTALVNYKCITNLKLISEEKPLPLLTIDLSGSVPAAITPVVREQVLLNW